MLAQDVVLEPVLALAPVAVVSRVLPAAVAVAEQRLLAWRSGHRNLELHRLESNSQCASTGQSNYGR